MPKLSRDSASRLLFFAFVLYVFMLLALQICHLYWMLIVYGRLNSSYGLDPEIAAHSWGFTGMYTTYYHQYTIDYYHKNL